MLNKQGIEEHFGGLKDKRREAGKRHKLIDIIVIAICGVISGADDWPGIEEYGLCKEEWLRSILALAHGTHRMTSLGACFG